MVDRWTGKINHFTSNPTYRPLDPKGSHVEPCNIVEIERQKHSTPVAFREKNKKGKRILPYFDNSGSAQHFWYSHTYTDQDEKPTIRAKTEAQHKICITYRARYLRNVFLFFLSAWVKHVRVTIPRHVRAADACLESVSCNAVRKWSRVQGLQRKTHEFEFV